MLGFYGYHQNQISAKRTFDIIDKDEQNGSSPSKTKLVKVRKQIIHQTLVVCSFFSFFNHWHVLGDYFLAFLPFLKHSCLWYLCFFNSFSLIVCIFSLFIRITLIFLSFSNREQKIHAIHYKIRHLVTETFWRNGNSVTKPYVKPFLMEEESGHKFMT